MTVEEYINSGIIEMYVMGALAPEEAHEVISFASKHPEVLIEIEDIRITLEAYAFSNCKSPGTIVKPLLLATLDYLDRLENGEVPVPVPLLSKSTTPQHFSEWIQRADMQLPEDFNDIYIKLIAYTSTVSTAIVWLNNQLPKETHHFETEHFLILEGTCTITVNDHEYHLYPGDQFTVPLHASHMVQITSAIPCKLILQRKAI